MRSSVKRMRRHLATAQSVISLAAVQPLLGERRRFLGLFCFLVGQLYCLDNAFTALFLSAGDSC